MASVSSLAKGVVVPNDQIGSGREESQARHLSPVHHNSRAASLGERRGSLLFKSNSWI